jgi:hypothetical protein
MHYRDGHGAEVDWVLEDSRGRVVGIEVKVRIPVEADHPYRSKPISDSAPSRSLIPEQADHPYRSQADHFGPIERNRA